VTASNKSPCEVDSLSSAPSPFSTAVRRAIINLLHFLSSPAISGAMSGVISNWLSRNWNIHCNLCCPFYALITLVSTFDNLSQKYHVDIILPQDRINQYSVPI